MELGVYQRVNNHRVDTEKCWPSGNFALSEVLIYLFNLINVSWAYRAYVHDIDTNTQHSD